MFKLKKSKILLLYLMVITFSGIFLFASCEQEYDIFLTGGGPVSAKLGDSTINYRDTVGSAYYHPNQANVLLLSSPNLNLQMIIWANAGFVGSYPLGNNNYYNISGATIAGVYAANNPYSSYKTDSTNTGIFTINSYNPQLQIISGTFHFRTVLYDSAGHPVPADTLVVSNGNFLIHLSINRILDQ